MTVSITVSRDPGGSTATGTIPVASGPTGLETVQAARETLEKKQVIVDKLGNFWKVVNVISGALEALSDVLDSWLLIWTMLIVFDSYIPLSAQFSKL